MSRVRHTTVSHAGLRLVALVFAVLSLARPSSALAYRTAGDLAGFASTDRVRWGAENLSVYVQESADSGLSNTAVAAAVQASIDTWTKVDCGSLPTLKLTKFRSGAQIEVEWVSDWQKRGFSAAAVGTTDVSYTKNGGVWQIDHAVIYLKSGDAWAKESTLSQARDLQAVLTHELGHALGLLHNCEPGGADGAPLCLSDDGFRSAVMYPDYTGLGQRTLGDDDRAGICFLFDKAASSVSRSSPDAGQLQPDSGMCAEPSARAPETVTSNVCGSSLLPFGEACTRPDECSSGLCIVEDEVGTCTQRCSDSCPAGYQCHGVDTDSICLRSSSSGCALRPVPYDASFLWIVPFVLTFARMTRRRCRHS